MYYTESEILSKVESFRKENKEYDKLISSIEKKLNMFIDMKNNKLSYNPKSSVFYKPKFEVDAVMMNSEEREILLRYLGIKYIDKVGGDYFNIKKRLFSNKYKVYTIYSDW